MRDSKGASVLVQQSQTSREELSIRRHVVEVILPAQGKNVEFRRPTKWKLNVKLPDCGPSTPILSENVGQVL